jgi:pyruvate formate lyase activating enzyme
MKAVIFDIKRFAVHDGPGIRTTIFFKGCPLTCPWCHNPESRSCDFEQYEHIDKIGDRVFKSQKTVGRYYTIDELLEEVSRDTVFYKESNGGITCSGGEPLMQHEFLYSFLRKCKARKLHVALDTSGFADIDHLSRISPYVDLFLYDIKHVNNKIHIRSTGKENTIILANFNWLINNGCNVIGRIPVIPGVSGDKKYIKELATYLGERMNPNFNEVHLLPYHRIGYAKHAKFGINGVRQFKEPSDKMMAGYAEIFREHGFKIKIGG